MKQQQRIVDVVAAVAVTEGSVLLADRRDVAGPDNWEFPGGKREIGETLEAALKRELREELGVESLVFDLLGTAEVARPDKLLRLHFLRTLLLGKPRAAEHQHLRRCPLAVLTREGRLLPADGAFAAYLELWG